MNNEQQYKKKTSTVTEIVALIQKRRKDPSYALQSA